MFTSILALYKCFLVTYLLLFIFYLFGVLCHFQHFTGHITTGSWKGRGNQYIQLVKVLCCKLLTNGKQLPACPLEGDGNQTLSQRLEASVNTLLSRSPLLVISLENLKSSNDHMDNYVSRITIAVFSYFGVSVR